MNFTHYSKCLSRARDAFPLCVSLPTSESLNCKVDHILYIYVCICIKVLFCSVSPRPRSFPFGLSDYGSLVFFLQRFTSMGF